MSSLTCLASPRIAAMWRGVSPRSFLLLTLSFCRDEALLGTFFCTGVVCEGWLGVESGHMEREKDLNDARREEREKKKKAHHTLRQLFFSLDWTTTVNPVLLGQTALNPCLSKHTCIWTFLGITHARLNAWCQYRVWWIHNILVTNFSSTADEHWWQRMTYMNKWRKKNSQNCQQRNGKEMTYYSTYQEEVTFSHSTGYSKTSHLL